MVTIEHSVDTDPERGNGVKFDKYREDLDLMSGLQRVGIFDPEIYEDSLAADSLLVEVEYGMPVAVHNSLTRALLNREVDNEYLIATHPSAIEKVKRPLLIPLTNYLSTKEVNQIFQEPKTFDARRLMDRSLKSLSYPDEGVELTKFKNGFPEYQIYSNYTLEYPSEFKKEIEKGRKLLEDGKYIADPEYISERIDEIARLHTDVFTAQSLSMGYYGGLSREELIDFSKRPDVNVMAGLDNFGVVESVAIFTDNASNIDWLNPLRYDHLNRGLAQCGASFQIPFVISTSENTNATPHFANFMSIAYYISNRKFEGRNGFPIEEYRLTYESSDLSIRYTPKIINRSLLKAGFIPRQHIVEQNFYAAVNSNN